ncbi:unnamed protein product [Arctia plantaginis]|uniref:Uncharacterized protein n=1 Tax=Arctia plantaginis TaxID=874455 RepID=A0A8S1AHP2_ARCPL|nr:unnamed protein product [Arctia plantaginis]CAB3260567.1 unnamed protein product [Arctia plantaginis]
MKQQSWYSANKKKSSHNNLNKISAENNILRERLRVATDKQHQEMSRAIDLKEKNDALQARLHQAKLEAFKLKELNIKLKNIVT